MRFCLDENISPRVLRAAQAIYGDRVSSVNELGMLSEKDVELFGLLVDAGFDVLVTHDKGQMVNPSERAELSRSGLSWVGIPQPSGRGTKVFAQDLAHCLQAFAHVEQWGAGWSRLVYPSLQPPRFEEA